MRLPEEVERLIVEVLMASGLDLPGRAAVESELRAHFEDGLDAGVPADELIARFGDPRITGRRIAATRRGSAGEEHTREGWWWMSAGEWWTEVKRAIRRLARTPGFAVVMIATLALGVGANTAVFTVVDAVMLRPLPYKDPDRLVRVYEADPEDPANQNYMRAPTVAAYRTWSDVFDGFGGLYTYRTTTADLTVGDRTDRVIALSVTAGYFETLGVLPELGRTFREEESVAPGAPAEGSSRGQPLAAVAILSHGLWQSRFGGARDILGRTIRLDDVPYTVVGVMPKGFTDPFGARTDVWRPQDLRLGGSNNWGNYFLSGVARLKEGLTLRGAQERVDALYARLEEEHPEARSNWVPRLEPLHRDLVGATRRTMLLILAGAAGLVLLTACVNLANLLFARGLSRDRDVAVRAALGSGRGRIVAGLLVESGLLALVGGTAGLVLGWLGLQALLALAPDALPMVARPRLGLGVFAFALGATLVALTVSGVTPALRIASTPPADALRSEGRSHTGGRRTRRMRDALAVVQVAMALMLVAGAALLGRSLAALRDVPLHMDPHGVLAFEVNLPTARYPDGASRQAFHRQLEERVEALPEVEAAGAVSWLPLNGRYHIWGVYWDPEHMDGSNDDAWYSTDIRVFAGDYFGTLGIKLIEGTDPANLDPEGERLIWVNRRFARSVFGDASPVGQQVYAGNEVRRVAGVVDDVPYNAEGDVSRKLYIPHAQFADNRNWPLVQTVRVQGDLAAARDDVRRVLAGLDGQLVLYRPRSLETEVAEARAQNRFATALMGAFAILALILSVVGTYGILAGSVAGRTKEFGIRIALGADRSAVRRLVLRYAAALVAPGVLLGLGGAWLGSRWLQALLFHVEPQDPPVYLGTLLLFVAVGFAAGWVPARRATRVDPARTLSIE